MSDMKIEAMREGGKILAQVRQALIAAVEVGASFEEIEQTANKEIARFKGAQPSFKMVPGYDWATCVMVNDAVCHGIPKNGVIREGDLVSIDVGVFYRGFHTDTTASTYVGKAPGYIQRFLETGRRALKKAISQATVGRSVWHISRAIQETIEGAGYSCVYQLTGHGVGKELHEEPSIPCVAISEDRVNILYEGQTIAIEPMYVMGDAQLIQDSDGWTFRTKDGSLSGMFEDTVLITKNGPEVLTK